MTKGAVGAIAPAVQQPGGDLLADARRPHDEHAAAGPATRFSVARTPLIARRAAGEVRLATGRDAQAGEFATQTFGFGRAGDQQQQPLRLERLFDEIARAAPDRGDGGVEIAMAGNDQHGDRGIAPLDLVEQFETVEA